MKVFEKTSDIDCNIEDLFNFHLDLNNLQRITPSDVQVNLIGKPYFPKQGDIVKMTTSKYFITTYWEIEIALIEEYNKIIDLACKSPFKFWKHSHVFTQKENGTSELKDIIEFEMPFGFVGNLFNSLVAHELKIMFEYRHDVTRKLLENDTV